jgi:hypothetical protein
MPRRFAQTRLLSVAALIAALVVAPEAFAATLSNESSVGLSSEYASNPFMQPSGAHSAESGALLADIPVSYGDEAQSLELDPKVRWAKTHGELALLSDYQYLDGIWKLDTGRNEFSADIGWHRDSTLYNVFENAALNGLDLRRREQLATTAWKRLVGERSDFKLSGSFDQVDYSHNSNLSLDNFRYEQVQLEYGYALTERTRWTADLGYARYLLRNHAYTSDNRSVQTSLVRALSEEWTATAQVGYSRLSASQLAYICCAIHFVPNGYYLQVITVNEKASAGTFSYTVDLERTGERARLGLTASRLIQPSGFGALLVENDVALKVSYPWTERWALSASLRGSQQSDSLQALGVLGRHFYGIDLGANWNWTEYWFLGLQGSYAWQRVSQPSAGLPPQSHGVTVFLTLTRQFGRIRL